MSRFLAGRAGGLVMAGVVVAVLLQAPARANAATPVGAPARPAAPTIVAPSAAATPHRVSPYAVYAKKHAQAAPGTAHAPSVPPTMKRTRQAVGQGQR